MTERVAIRVRSVFACSLFASLAVAGCRAAAPEPPAHVRPSPVARDDVQARLARITSNLSTPAILEGTAPERFSLDNHMAELSVPGVSIAVADDWRIVWARGFGRRVATEDDPVSPSTLFQAASIGKVIFATASLRLVSRASWTSTAT